MKRLLPLLLSALFVLFACQTRAAPRDPYSAGEAQALLMQLGSHVMVINSDLTLIRKKPARELDLLTYYPLPKAKVDEYRRNGHIVNRNDDIADFATYRVKDYELTNEKHEKLQMKNDIAASPLQDFSLWTYDQVLCSQRGFYVKLDKTFERVRGHITLVFEMPGNVSREIRVPVDLSIADKDPRPGI
ncbi:hypothetical protein SAMN05518845_115176 [Variovorax sp. YR750]|uniref:hypothetical protein n=1 Tax=Variovorax sp. YR750 TaxID=1884384 RepID=UPI0008CAAC95|nr:hypothetical protein [Variovorax sp. YR750]SEM06389.1 hypothetical protein SAMN05518845_115176 [Variovorax sp. YR750]